MLFLLLLLPWAEYLCLHMHVNGQVGFNYAIENPPVGQIMCGVYYCIHLSITRGTSHPSYLLYLQSITGVLS